MAKKCGHVGRIARRQKTGQITCYRQNKTKVTITVGDEDNLCEHPTCPFAGRRIPRTEDDGRGH